MRKALRHFMTFGVAKLLFLTAMRRQLNEIPYFHGQRVETATLLAIRDHAAPVWSGSEIGRVSKVLTGTATALILA